MNEKVKRLKARGMVSPYLKGFVVARINPIRFKPRGSAMPAPTDVLEKMLAAAQKFDPDRIKSQDLARAGGPPEGTE